MLPAAHRLRTAADFTETTRRGRKAARGSVVVYLITESSDVPARLGVITSRVVGGSVARHRAARRIRSAARSEVLALPAGTRVVVRALAGSDRSPSLADDVRDGITSLAAKASRR